MRTKYLLPLLLLTLLSCKKETISNKIIQEKPAIMLNNPQMLKAYIAVINNSGDTVKSEVVTVYK